MLSTVTTIAKAQQQYAVRIFFKDKNNTTYSLSQPQAYLSQRAIDRRTKYNIAIDSSDLPVNKNYVDSILNYTNGVLHLTSKWMNYAVMLLPDTLLLSTISGFNFVNTTEVIAHYTSTLHSNTTKTPFSGNTPQNHSYTPTAFNFAYYGEAWQQIRQCKGEHLHKNGYMGEGIIIAVLDAGFSAVNQLDVFDTIRSNNRILDTWNFVIDTVDVYGYNNHGTLVLSCMAANDAGGYVGTAPAAQYALYLTDDNETEQYTETDNWLAAAERADSIGADIINSSLGYNTFDDTKYDFTYNMLDGKTTLVTKAANKAVDKGILVICSAGNEGNSAWGKILAPADGYNVIAVGAVNNSGNVGSFSSKGPNALGEIKPNVATRGVNAAVVTQSGNVTNISGTSFAAPILSGMAACLLQASPNTSPLAIKNIIEKSASHAANPNNEIGYGIPDFSKALLALDIIIPKQKNIDIWVYPNPAKEKLMLQLQNKITNLNYKFYDLLGKKVLENSITNPGNENSIDISSLQPGVYLLQIAAQNQTITQKIIVEQ